MHLQSARAVANEQVGLMGSSGTPAGSRITVCAEIAHDQARPSLLQTLRVKHLDIQRQWTMTSAGKNPDLAVCHSDAI